MTCRKFSVKARFQKHKKNIENLWTSFEYDPYGSFLSVGLSETLKKKPAFEEKGWRMERRELTECIRIGDAAITFAQRERRGRGSHPKSHLLLTLAGNLSC